VEGIRWDIQKVLKYSLKSIFDHWHSSTAVLLGIIKVMRLVRGLGINSGEDGWRRTTRAYFRTEHSKGTVAAMGLSIPPGDKPTITGDRMEVHDRLAKHLGDFLRTQEFPHRTLAWTRWEVKIERSHPVDLVKASYRQDGSLLDLASCFDPVEPLPGLAFEEEQALRAEVIRAYNVTRDITDKKRPRQLEREIQRRIRRRLERKGSSAATLLLKRLLRAAYLVVEKLPPNPEDPAQPDPVARLTVPDLYRYRHPGRGTLTILARIHPGMATVDLWLHVNHIVWDGMPLQEVIDHLRLQWGSKDFLVPRGWEKGRFYSCLPYSQDRKGIINLAHDFVDFRPLRETRAYLNECYGRRVRGGISIPCILFWLLGVQESFSGLKLLLPVDVPPTANKERTLGLMFIRPSRYRNPSAPLEGFLRFQQELNDLVLETRERRSVFSAVLDAYSIVPAPLFSVTLSLLPIGMEAAFGTTGVTFMRTAQIVLAPMSDVHTDGFVSVGSFDLPTENDTFVASVSAKGYGERPARYLGAVKAAVATAPSLLERYAPEGKANRGHPLRG
jgi:hypothetical protein